MSKILGNLIEILRKLPMNPWNFIKDPSESSILPKILRNSTKILGKITKGSSGILKNPWNFIKDPRDPSETPRNPGESSKSDDDPWTMPPIPRQSSANPPRSFKPLEASPWSILEHLQVILKTLPSAGANQLGRPRSWANQRPRTSPNRPLTTPSSTTGRLTPANFNQSIRWNKQTKNPVVHSRIEAQGSILTIKKKKFLKKTTIECRRR